MASHQPTSEHNVGPTALAEEPECVPRNGFRRNRRLEDNLFVLTQTIEVARRETRGLLGCFLDVAKAYDSVPHEEFFHQLDQRQMPSVWTDFLRRLYADSSVVACFRGTRTQPVRVTRGLRQGCPLSPLLYMLYVAGLEQALVKSGVGFAFRLMIGGVAQTWTLPGLVFADDLVLLAERSSDLQRLVTLAADHLKSLPDRGSIPVSNQYRYLGVNLCTSADIYDKQEEHVRQTSVRAANVLRRRSLWGCNRFVLVRELWKAVHVLVLTFANAVICLSAATRRWLERGQREVGQLALACHGRVAVEAIQGDLGWSSYEAREARSKAAYEGRLRLMNDQRWARRVFRYTAIKGMNTPWRRRLHNLCRKYSLFTDPVQEDSERKWAVGVRNRVQEAETSMWQAAMEKKPSLALYRAHKTTISAERLYDM
nr:uncharacterized protein LOC119164611 [Rhipicephalus microplus]